MLIILVVPVALLIYKLFKPLFEDVNPKIGKAISLFTALLILIFASGVISEIYYSSDLPELSYDQIDLHPSTGISLDQYVAQEPITLMDKEHNLHCIDLDKSEITFSTESSKAFVKTQKSKGIWKLFVLEWSRTSYSVQFLDYYSRYSS